MKIKYLSIIVLLLLVLSCSSKKKKVDISFYHWKSSLDLKKVEIEYLNDLKVKKLYVRFFDVDWNPNIKEAVPIGHVSLNSIGNLDSLQVVPTIFITNRTLLNISDKKIPELAQNIITKILRQAKKLEKVKIVEIQLDCDWTDKTKHKFFQLIENVKNDLSENKKLKIPLSATIRLHQIKYFKRTGVPPVNRGMLMFYNMGNIDGSNTNNSILDLKIAESYLKKADNYPLPLDIALPIYSWAVLERRGRVINLLNNIRPKDLAQNKNMKKLKSKQYKVKKSHYFQGIYLYKNDKLRVEDISQEDLEKSAELLKNISNQDTLTVTYYHLDKSNLEEYGKGNLEKINDILK